MVTEPYVHLTGTERRILEALSKANGQPIKWSALAIAAMGYDNPASLRVHIHRMRKKVTLDLDVISGYGVRLAVTHPCPHCRGTGYELSTEGSTT